VKILSAAEAARNFRKVIHGVECNQEEILLVRNGKAVARLVPEAAPQNALEIFGDLYRTPDDQTGDAMSSAISAARKRRY
jgi:antitoxin (DNA-binding transcriptional repressor) of toxin-antitoxin stability system